MNESSTINIVWFRRDLRITDNDALSRAAETGQPTIGVFTLDPWFFKQPEISGVRVQFLFESLQSLAKNLEAKGSQLYTLEGRSDETIETLLVALKQTGKSPRLYFNRDVQVTYGIDRDRRITDFCHTHSIELYKGLRSFIQIEKKPYNSWIQEYYDYQSRPIYPIPAQIANFDAAEIIKAFNRIDPTNLSQWAVNLGLKLRRSELFIGGEREAQRLLKSFADERYHGYHWKLSRPYLAQCGATSQLSPHLALGTISTRVVNQTMYARKQALKGVDPKGVLSIASFIDRLRWCDSFSQRLYEHPEIMWQNRFPEFDAVYTDEPLEGEKQELFNAWCRGTTGFSLLDASMRQLNEQGWINFRMRAQAATMLTIVFGISWHHGARYFMQKLVDGDIAINHWQWQMQAGVTNPLSPVMRIYNPSKNLETKDPDLKYVNFWLPETKQYKTPAELLAAEKHIIDYAVYRKHNGKIISDIRKIVRRRVMDQKGTELNDATTAKDTVVRYNQRTEERYTLSLGKNDAAELEDNANK